jgi:CheY-like chemotaxis protein
VANLLHNAAKFTPEGGRIAITARRENGHVVVSVRDTGPGIPVEDRERIFEIFAQGARSHDRPTGGLGLGLTLARRLAELHGGTLEAVSGGPQGGSEFVARLPVAAAPPPASGGHAATPPPEPSPLELTGASARKRRILVVDDNADARAAMELLLVDEGHEVRGAGDGPEALDEARRFRPEIVFLDIGLPGMDGYDVARALRAEPAGSGALIVAVSGYGQAEDRARSRVAGFDQHLLKPVTPERLLEVVRRAGA